MTASFLDLSDESLLSIFLALGSEELRDYGYYDEYMNRVDTSGPRNLSKCSRRLNTIYRNSVRTLRLGQMHSTPECFRFAARFPYVTTLDIDLHSLPLSTPRDCPVHWCGEPGAFPNGLVRNGIKSISLDGNGLVQIHVQELRTMLENCAGLEELTVTIHPVRAADNEFRDFATEMRSFSLERHVESLKNLRVRQVTTSAFEDVEADRRWFHLPRMTSLTQLTLQRITPLGNGFSDLSLLTSLEYMALGYLDIEDNDIHALLPSLPNLRRLLLCGCRKLTYRVLVFLSSHQLDLLDVSATTILTNPTGAERIQARPTSFRTGHVKFLTVKDIKRPRFEYFLRHFDGASIEHLKLERIKNLDSDTLPYILSKAPGLRILDLKSVSEDVHYWGAGLHERASIALNDGTPRAISELANLRKLIVQDTDFSENCLPILASGPCRYSLRIAFISVNRRPGPRGTRWVREMCLGNIDTDAVRQIFSEYFASCDLLLDGKPCRVPILEL